MAYSVEMPALGESVTEGTVTRWLKQEGEEVAVDEPLLEVSTDKVDTEIPSPVAGVLQRIVVPEDETVEVGAQLALIGDEAGSDGNSSGSDGDSSGSDSHGGSPQTAEQPPESAAAEPEPQPEPPAAPQPEPPAAPQPEPQRGPGSAPAAASSGGSGGDSGTPVTMPALGESVTEGTVTRWLKQVGDTVALDEALLEVSTDKVDTEIPSPVAGTVLEISVGADETVEVGARLAVVGDPSRSEQQDRPAEPPPQPEPPRHQEQRTAPPRHEQPAAPTGAQGDGAASTPYVTPLVRKLAAEYGVDLSAVQGTGVGGRIRKQDVLAVVEQAEPEPEPEPEAPSEPVPQREAQAPPEPSPATATEARGRTEKMSRLRKVIATRMVESLRVSAQLTTVAEADITRIARLRDRAKRDFETREGVRLSFLPFFAKATVEALKQHPKVNASIDQEAGEITYHGAEHLGIAVDTDRGLLVPVIHDAGDLNLPGLARRITDLAERTRLNKITPDELGGGTFTLSNTGSRGALFDTPIINQPQVGILGTGAVVKRPMVLSGEEGDTLAIRSMILLALSYDHRLVDGADAARFLNAVKERLEEGAFETDLGL